MVNLPRCWNSRLEGRGRGDRTHGSEGGEGDRLSLPLSVGASPSGRFNRQPTWSEQNPDGRWREYGYEELINRDKASLDIFWLRDESLSDPDNLPAPEVIAAEIVEDLEAALEQFREILGDMGESALPVNV